MTDCVFCQGIERQASRDIEYLICSNCVTKLMLMAPEKRGRLYDLAMRVGFDEKAKALKENFTLGKAEIIDLIPLIKAKGLRAIAREVGVCHKTVQKWVAKGRVSRRYIDLVKKACA